MPRKWEFMGLTQNIVSALSHFSLEGKSRDIHQTRVISQLKPVQFWTIVSMWKYEPIFAQHSDFRREARRKEKEKKREREEREPYWPD